MFYVKAHRTPDGDVEYDAKLWDPGSNQNRQVDVVIRGTVGDDPVTISVEVKDEAEPLGTQEVERLIGVHQRMGTHRLVFVSWSGFVEGARNWIEQNRHWVEGITPERVDKANFPPLTWVETTAVPDGVVLTVREPDGSLTRVNDVPPDVNIYAKPDHGALIYTLNEFLDRYLNRHGRRRLAEHAMQSDKDESDIKWFKGTMSLEEVGVELYAHDGDEFKRLSTVWFRGPYTIHTQALGFEVWRLGDNLFAFSEFTMHGENAVLVYTPTDEESGLLSWQLLDRPISSRSRRSDR